MRTSEDRTTGKVGVIVAPWGPRFDDVEVEATVRELERPAIFRDGRDDDAAVAPEALVGV
eukprot:CAMPEP_0198662114 /NCGR_PEP_ID=MMETSP1467-20131203/45846_1 /TAXON_ID=1462469 /ORGANISM="unid. sp., Strain CCMP2135" /LENGTH=59 /DNA_ID=CAMNT_0044398587 /DNA_START=348 /DNA_END=525 /DNA_ORIENTATION=-